MDNTTKTILPPIAQALSLEEIKKPFKPAFSAIDALIKKQLENQLALTQTVCEYIIDSGGKRLRPLILLLTTHMLAHQGEEPIQLAAILEFLHTATLLHDDVIDHSKLRRNRQTANTVWDNETSILMGDFLHALSFEMIVDMGKIDVMKVLAQATNTIVNGEITQLIWRKNIAIKESDYKAIIGCKTARLFSVATEVGALIAGADQQIVQSMKTYGDEFGMVYQLMDDLQDYTGCMETMGKNIGDDLAEGKLTLPLIYALRTGTKAQSQQICQAIEESSLANLENIIQIIHETGAIQYTHEQAHQHAQQALIALHQLPQHHETHRLASLVDFVLRQSNNVNTG